MWSAAAGMNVQTTNMDTISNNLANVNTTGFKKQTAEFQDLLYQTINIAGTNTTSTTILPGNIQVGHGARLSSLARDFSTGSMKQTTNPYDMAIQGAGFFQVLMPDGTYAYTRDGSFSLDQNGNLVTANGQTLQPQITIPQDSLSVTIGTDGTVSVTQPGQSQPTQVGQITIANFINPNGLNAIGNNLYQATQASGDPVQGTPGLTGLGNIQQSFLEVSNVDMATEMVNMIIGQRAYEANSKTIETVNAMLQLLTTTLKQV
jgi:flagellar basal-body rod protein FlgG